MRSVGPEAAPPPPPPVSTELRRDDWMTMPLGASDRSLSILTERQRETEERLEEEEERKVSDKWHNLMV